MYLLEKYAHFKDNIHQLFPIIYDTKFLSYKLRDLLHVNGNYLYIPIHLCVCVLYMFQFIKYISFF